MMMRKNSMPSNVLVLHLCLLLTISLSCPSFITKERTHLLVTISSCPRPLARKKNSKRHKSYEQPKRQRSLLQEQPDNSSVHIILMSAQECTKEEIIQVFFNMFVYVLILRGCGLLRQNTSHVLSMCNTNKYSIHGLHNKESTK